MLRLAKNEWRKVCAPVLAAGLFLSLAMSILSCTLYRDYQLQYEIEAWEIATEFVDFLFPLFAVLPLCWNLYYEQKDRFLVYVCPRMEIRTYLAVKWIVQAICAFCLLFFPYMLSAMAALYIKPPIEAYVPQTEINPFLHVFAQTFTETPLVYAVLLSLWKGVLGVLIMSFGFVLAMYVENIFVILTGPFLYMVLGDFILSILRLEKYRLITSFEPTAISARAYTAGAVITGPLLLLVVIGGIWFWFAKICRRSAAKV